MSNDRFTSANSQSLILLTAVIALGLAGCATRQLVPAKAEVTSHASQ